MPAGSQSSWQEQAALPSEASRNALHELTRLARTPITITLVGPSGSGKSAIGQGVHEHSARADGPLVMENLSAIPEALTASELFGHVKGSFSGALVHRRGLVASAHTGTLVLDELTKCPTPVQHALLGVLDGRGFRPVGADRQISVDVRLVAMTSVPLEVAVKRGELIPDLYERLRTTVVRLRPLDERREDVLPVATTALMRLYRAYGYTKCPRFDDRLARLLHERRWPGNHRHVVGVVERILANAGGAPILTSEHYSTFDEPAREASARDRFIADYLAGLQEAHAGPTAAGRTYGASRPTIRRWIKMSGESVARST